MKIMDWVLLSVVITLFWALVVGLLVGFQLLIERWQHGPKTSQMNSDRVPAKETDNQIVMHFPTWVRGLGGFIVLMGAGFGTASIVFGLEDNDIVSFIIFACIGLPALLGGIWIIGYTFKITFDYTLGDMTIRTGVGPFIYRTRHFSNKQVQSVRSFISEEGPYVRVWAVSLRIAGRKKDMKIMNNVDESRANYLATRITEFIE